MKKLLSTLFLALLLVLPASASAQLTVPQGGTGYNALQAGSIIFGDTTLRVGTSTALQFNKTAGRLTVTYASTTALSATTLCISTDCRTAWPTGTVAGNDTEVQFNDGGAAFGGDSAFTWNKTADRLTVTYASSTGLTATTLFTSSLVIGGDTFDELVGTGLTISSGDLQTTLGTAIDSSEITNGTIVVGDLASADFGDITCNGTTCTIDAGVVVVGDLASADFGDFTCNGTACTVDANAIALTTDTTGNYVETVSSSGSITVAGSGAEDADVTVNLNMGNANTWTALQTFTNASTTGMATFGHASSTQWSGGGLIDCDSDAATLGWDATTRMFTCGDDDSGIGGGIATIQENDSDVTTAATVIDFGVGFDVTGAAVEGDITLDLLEYNGAALFTNVTMTNASSSAISANTLAVGGTATTSISSAGTITIGGNIVFAGDTIDELVGTGLQLTSGDLQTTLGTAIDSTEITDGQVAAADLATADFGDFSCSAGSCTVDANAIALGTDTTGNYLATLADDGQGTITVNNSGTETAAVTLRVVDVVCTDCLGATEIADSYLLNTGDVGTGDYDFGGASSFEIVNAAAPTVNAAGEIALDTTDNQLVVGDSGNAEAVFGRKETELFKFDLASTSPRFVSGSYQPLPQFADGYTVTKILCYTSGGTSKQIAVSDGTNDMDTITCDADGATDDGSIANSTATAAEIMRVKMLTTSGAVDSVSVTIIGTITRE